MVKEWTNNLISSQTIVPTPDGGTLTKPQQKLRDLLAIHAPPMPRKPKDAFWIKRIYYHNASEDLDKRHKLIEYHKSKGMKHLEDFEEVWKSKESKAMRRSLVFVYTVESIAEKDVVQELETLHKSFTKEDWEHYVPPPRVRIMR